MKVWIFQTGEPMPLVSEGSRPMRTMNLTNYLINNGHEVVIWTSTFSHQLKKFLVENKYSVIQRDNVEVRLIPSLGYKKNVSIKRLLDHLLIAYVLYRRLKIEKERPDILFVGFPPIFFCNVAVKWAKKNKIPVMIDIKDRWPEVFIFKAPNLLKPLVKFSVLPSEHVVKNIFLKADAISTISKGFLSWIRTYSGRSYHSSDKVFYLTPGRKVDAASAQVVLSKASKKRNVDPLTILFVGSFSHSFDFRPIIEAARYAREHKLNWHFSLCGYGPQQHQLEREAVHLTNLRILEAVDELKYQRLAEKADAAIAPYERTPDFQLSIPNKIFDYMSFGLPIITSLDGELGSFLKSNECGLVYSTLVKKDLTKKLLFLSNNRNTLATYSINAKRKFNRDCSSGKVYPDLVAELEKLSKKRR